MTTIKIDVFTRDNKFIASIKVKGEPGEEVPQVFADGVIVDELWHELPDVFPESNTLYKVHLLTGEQPAPSIKKFVIGGALIAIGVGGTIASYLYNKNK